VLVVVEVVGTTEGVTLQLGKEVVVDLARSLTTTAGSGTTPGNSADASRGTYGNGAPAGGTGENSASTRLGLKGKNGLVIISWT
jgi:hypothetical protein